MHGDEGNQPSVADAAPRPVHPARRIVLWVGLALALTGVFLLGDTTARLDLALGFVGHWWAWGLLGLAAVNIAMSVIRPASLLAPGLLIAIALLGLAMQRGIATTVLLNFLMPVGLSLAGIAIFNLAGRPGPRSWTRVLLTGRVHADPAANGILRPKAFLGEIKADLRPLGDAPNDVEIHVTAILGHVRLTVPVDWNIEVGTGTLLTPVKDQMPNGTGDRKIPLRVLGFCGFVTVVRT